SEPQPPPSIAQPTNEEPIPTVVSSSHQKTQTPRQALKEVTELPQTSEPISNVPDEAVYEESDDRVVVVSCAKKPWGVPLLRLGLRRRFFKQGRKIDEIDQDPDITLVQHDAEIQGRHRQEMKFETEVYTAEDVSTTSAAVTTAGAFISTASPPRVSIDEDISTAETLVYIRRNASKDKGKAKMDESGPEQTKTKLQQRQERTGYEAAVSLQEQLDEEERKRIFRVHKEASSFNIEEWEDIQATIEAGEELAQRIQAEEKEKYSETEKARLLTELIK
ncbi:hypothetical protein Tco_1061181, partial [Tanacetum coccineum]